jgi:hypothetical protein
MRREAARAKLHFMALDRNPHFVGHEDVIISLDDYFATTKTSARATLYGIGGVGYILTSLLLFPSSITSAEKMQCTVSYCYSVRDESYVLWVGVHHTSALKTSFSKIAETLDLLVWKDATSSVHQWLQQHDGQLLVFDNVGDINLIRPYLPSENTHAAGRFRNLILTKRDSAIVGSESVPFGIEVTLLGNEDAIRLFVLNLQSWTPVEHDQIRTKIEGVTTNPAIKQTLNDKYGFANFNQMEKIAELTGRLPLAIVQCASYLRQYPTNYPEYIRKFKANTTKARQRFFSHSPKGAHYSESIVTTWEISLECIVQGLPGAGELLTMFGFLDRTEISMGFTESALHELTFWKGKCAILLALDLRAKFQFLEMGAEYTENSGILKSLSLISQESTKRQISMHPLVHEWTHLRLHAPLRAEWLVAVIRILYHRLPPFIYSTEDRNVPHQAEIVLYHTERCKELVGLHIGNIQHCDPEVAIFFLEIYLWYRGQQCLDVAEAVAAKVRQKDIKWVMKLIRGARLHQIVQDFQGSRSSVLDEGQYQRYSSRLTSLYKDNHRPIWEQSSF